MIIKLGHIYWLTTEGSIAHPHVVIQIDDNDITVCGITTNLKKLNMPGNVLLDIGEGNLQKQSIVEVAKVFTVDKSELGSYIGELPIQRVEEIKSGIGFLGRTYFNK